ncbi:PIN-like domain-containing protein [Microlunatus phosphovorus]|uniref:PIN-like domain-containing protein n=1 Tax=Microlunatus phosphovorus TaxID=29405 RepID=UPI0005A01DEE|nr:hypothetical protein [Microlunatus phosphovorus]
MTQLKAVTPRFYFDADVLGLAKLVSRERADCTYPGDPGGQIKKRLRPACIITTPATRDPVWIPAVAAQGWLIITRDKAIQGNRAEINAVRDNGAKMVNLASIDATNTWAQLEVLMTRWREIDRLADQPGPFIYVVSRTGKLRAVDLAP